MTAVLTAALVLGQQPKYVTLDDYQVGPYQKALTMGSDYHPIFGLDKRHCLFGQRRTWFQVNGNEDDLPLTLTVGNGEQKLSAPGQLTWNYSAEYGGWLGGPVWQRAMTSCPPMPVPLQTGSTTRQGHPSKLLPCPGQKPFPARSGPFQVQNAF
ncbi:MAG: hypothetical protein JST30_12980 [Armatimonadetes bacterium]|nr:hypothetical protein [Armatimonadota bacterium]